jgi:hypothetical protein
MDDEQHYRALFTQSEDMSDSQLQRLRDYQEDQENFDDSDDWWTYQEPPTEEEIENNQQEQDNEQMGQPKVADRDQRDTNQVDIGQYSQAWTDIKEIFS